MSNKVKNYYGVYENEIYDYKYYRITMIEEKYEKTASSEPWRKNTINIVREIQFNEYFNYLSSIGEYEKVEKSCTCKGYIPTKIISISPSKDMIIIRRFKIDRKDA